MFEKLPLLPADPILGLMQAFSRDTRPNKIDLGVGVFRDERGVTPVLEAVKQAEAILLQGESTKAYVGPKGLTDFNTLLLELILGETLHKEINDRTTVIQTPGGCGALRVAAELIMRTANHAPPTVWVSDPTWGNHIPLLSDAGLNIETYPYYDTTTHSVCFDDMMVFLEQTAKEGDLVLVHASCHNPSGADLTLPQWQALSALCAQKKLIPFVDMAYQGFGDGITEDAAGLRVLIEHNPELLLSYSCSKNFGLYRERVGAIVTITESPAHAAAISSQIQHIVRGIYSMPPSHGAAIVSTILSDASLRALWLSELNAMRERIKHMRTQLVAGFECAGLANQFEFIEHEKGMFSFLGLNSKQTQQLAQNFGVYMVDSSRINMAGLRKENIAHFVDCVRLVIAK